MKFTKMLGLAMVAAIAAMAFIGVGSASAVLCKVKETNCAAANQYPVPTEVLVHSNGVKLSGSLTVLCESEATLKHEGVKAGKLFGTITKLEFPKCTTGCTKATVTSAGTFEDEAIGEGNGRLFPKKVTVVLTGCPFGIECTAKSIATTSLTLDGGTINGTALGLANTEVELSGGLCGTKGKWETESGSPYIVTAVNGATTGSIFEE